MRLPANYLEFPEERYVNDSVASMAAYIDGQARQEEGTALNTQEMVLSDHIRKSYDDIPFIKSESGEYDIDAMLQAAPPELAEQLLKRFILGKVQGRIRNERRGATRPTSIGGAKHLTRVEALTEGVAYRRYFGFDKRVLSEPRSIVVAKLSPGEVLFGNPIHFNPNAQYGGRLVLKRAFGTLDVTGLVNKNAEPQVVITSLIPQN